MDDELMIITLLMGCNFHWQEMTLEEYEKVLEEKRKALLSMKAEERKVEVDKDLKSMKQLSTKKGTDEVFIKLVMFTEAY